MIDSPKVGVAVLILNDKMEVLIGLRKSKLGDNTWGLPGGKLNKYESIIDCVVRETKEETNLDVFDLNYVCTTNDIMLDEKEHYITMFFSSNNYKGDVKIMEPNKCLEWKWFNPKELPNNLFLPLRNFIEGNFIS